MTIIYSNSTNVFHNLAVEDALLDDDSVTLPVVYIYRNDDAVVIGKNQNPWRECAVGKLADMNVKLARRVTGGGTVFHDSGNVNISCILPRDSYHRKDMLNWTVSGLRSLGLEASLAKETSIVIDGKKVSGNAFCYRRNKVLHHGTLLWNADLSKLKEALKPALNDIETRAIESVRMDVVNLKEWLPQSTIHDVTKAIVESLSRRLGIPDADVNSGYVPGDLAERIEKMQSWKWLFGAAPDFIWSCTAGNLTLWSFDIHRGNIRSVTGVDRETSRKLTGIRFQRDLMMDALGETNPITIALDALTF